MTEDGARVSGGAAAVEGGVGVDGERREGGRVEGHLEWREAGKESLEEEERMVELGARLEGGVGVAVLALDER